MKVSAELLELLEAGDTLYQTVRVGVGNTTLRTTVIYDVVIKSIERYGADAKPYLIGKVKSAEVVWNGANRAKFYRIDLCKLHATHPKPVQHSFWGVTDEQHAIDCAEAAETAAKERKLWRDRRKSARELTEDDAYAKLANFIKEKS